MRLQTFTGAGLMPFFPFVSSVRLKMVNLRYASRVAYAEGKERKERKKESNAQQSCIIACTEARSQSWGMNIVMQPAFYLARV
jgi:hypothetical protein